MHAALIGGGAALAVGIGVGTWAKIDGDATDKVRRESYGDQSKEATAYLDSASKELGFEVTRPPKSYDHAQQLEQYLGAHRPPAGVFVRDVMSGGYGGPSFSTRVLGVAPVEQGGANGWIAAPLTVGGITLGYATFLGFSNVMEGISRLNVGGGTYTSGRALGIGAAVGVGLLAGTGIGVGIGALISRD